MKLKSLPLLGLALSLGFNTAHAGHRSFGDGLPDYLAKFDANEDGMIDEEERQAIKEAREAKYAEWIAQWDGDGDGELSDTEKEAARDAIRAEIEAKRAARFAEIAGEEGLLTLEEFSAIESLADVDPARVEAIFNRMDADDSGDVTLEEFTARLRHHRHRHHARPTDEEKAAAEEARRVARFDELAGEDGSISLEEFAATYPNLESDRVAELYAEIDADGLDGVTLDEFTYDQGAIAHEDWEAARAAEREARRVARFEELAGDDGSISLEEFAATYPNLESDRVAELYAEIDADGLDGVTLDEFTYDQGAIAHEDREAARAAARAAEAEARRVNRFSELAGEDDPDSISLEEYVASLPDLDPAEAEALFVAMDADGVGGVTLDEFTCDCTTHEHRFDRGGSHGWWRFSRHFVRRR